MHRPLEDHPSTATAFLPLLAVQPHEDKTTMSSTKALKDLHGLDEFVTGLAEDAERMMVLLYDLQKSLDRNNSTPCTNVRRELRIQWEGLRAYLQRCYGFGEDVLMLKDALGKQTTAVLVEFLLDMKASADELQDLSPDLKNKDMSVAFSKDDESGNSENAPNPSSIEGIKNPNLMFFIVAIGNPEDRQYIGQIDDALSRFTSNFEKMSKFWEDVYQACDSLINQFKNAPPSISPADANQIIANWKRCQEATTKAVASITRTNNAILVEPVNEVKGGRFGLGLLIGYIRKWLHD